jgi:hypothetical protein
MTQKFVCPDCGREVKYEKLPPTPGGIGFQTRRLSKGEKVYLECPAGHTNPYEVTEEEPGDLGG